MQILLKRPATCLAIALGLALALLAVDAAGRIHHYRSSSRFWTEASPSAGTAGASTGATGDAGAELLSLGSMDGYQWILHARRLAETGGWRVRRTEIDNFPAGREVHWSSSLIWGLRALGRFQATGSAPGTGQAIERAALYVCPLLLAGILVFLALAAYRRFGAGASCVVALALAMAPRFVELFRVGTLDHHGLVAAAGFACVLFAAAAGAGWVRADSASETPPGRTPGRHGEPNRAPGARTAAKWAIASALAGAAGLWVSAASQIPVLIGVGLGALAAAARWPRTTADPRLRYRPELWRTWGWAGAGGSLFFYLLEYFPHSMGMRLEVNHPLYAVAWAGGGELLFRACRKLRGGRLVERPGDRLAIPLAVAALAAGPVLVVLDPGRFFWVADRYFWTLNRDIREIHNIVRHVRDAGVGASLSTISILPLAAVPAGLALWRASMDSYRKAMLAVMLTPALVLGGMAVVQVRWLGTQEALWIAVLAILTALISDCTLRPPKRSGRVAAVFAVLMLLQFPLSVARSTVDNLRPPLKLGLEERMQLVMRDVARRLRSRAGDRPLVVLSGPTATTAMIYFGGCRGLGTLYWENRDGLEAAGAIFGASSLDTALRLILEHRITHLVFFSWDDFGETYARLHRELPYGQSTRDVFSLRSATPLTFPTWTQPLDYRIPPELGLKGQDVLILEVHPEQSADEHFTGMGAYCADRGDLPYAAACYQRSLELRPDQIAALIGMADVRIRSGRAAEAGPYLDRAAALAPVAGRAETARKISGLGQQLSPTDVRSAVGLFRRALAIDPQCRSAGNNLAWILATAADATLRNGPEAVELASEVVRVDGGDDPLSLDTLAAALARAGRWDEAIATASRAVQIAEEKGTSGLEEIRARRNRYLSREPYEQPARKPVGP